MQSPVEHWTEARYWTYVRSALRRAWSRYPNKHLCLKNARVARNQYLCAGCGKLFTNKEVCVDHINPCGSLLSYNHLPDFVASLLCPLDNLQVLCKNPCHYKKTLNERGLTEDDIQVAQFRKLNAQNQKNKIESSGLEPASNSKLREQQYRDTL